MFTFGRDHEKKLAVRNLRNPDDVQRATEVVDAVHNLIERKVSADSIRPIFVRAFSEGGSGVWEQTGSWLCKLSAESPELLPLWHECHRVRTAAVLFESRAFLITCHGHWPLNLANYLELTDTRKREKWL